MLGFKCGRILHETNNGYWICIVKNVFVNVVKAKMDLLGDWPVKAALHFL